MIVGKIVFMLIVSAVALTIGLLPEGLMYWVWHLVNPTEAWERLVLVALFILGGGSITVLAWFIAGAGWITLLMAVIE